jgi:5-methyltetrahydropteroyltriglutamate--homocysteine methyltransferase
MKSRLLERSFQGKFSTPIPEILTTTVGSYSPIDWLAALPSEQAVLDATSVVISTQQRAGIDLPTDGVLYRFDVNHPDTNGMIEYFISRITRANLLAGMDWLLGVLRRPPGNPGEKPSRPTTSALTTPSRSRA